MMKAVRENEAAYGARESEVRFAKKKRRRPRYAKVGGTFSEALKADEWAKFTHSISTGLDAGLRVSEDSILVECENGDYKFVIYDNDSPDRNILTVYKIEEVNYNITDLNSIASFIYEAEGRKYDKQKILDRILRNYAKEFGFFLGRYSTYSKRFVDIRRKPVENQKNVGEESQRTDISENAGESVSGTYRSEQLKGKKSKNDAFYFDDIESLKERQNSIVQQNNSMHDDYHTGIRGLSVTANMRKARTFRRTTLGKRRSALFQAGKSPFTAVIR